MTQTISIFQNTAARQYSEMKASEYRALYEAYLNDTKYPPNDKIPLAHYMVGAMLKTLGEMMEASGYKPHEAAEFVTNKAFTISERKYTEWERECEQEEARKAAAYASIRQPLEYAT